MKCMLVFVAALFCAVTGAYSMEMNFTENWNGEPQLYLSGPVEIDDPQKLSNMLDLYPSTRWIVVGQSPGGALYGGIGMAKIIHTKNLAVEIQGPAASAATVISLGAAHHLKYWEGGMGGALGSQLLFHCAYLQGTDFCDEAATRDSSEILAQLTGRSAEDWMDELMQTTPDTVVDISLQRILGYDDWRCHYVTGYGDCWRGDIRAEDDIASAPLEVLLHRMAQRKAGADEEMVIDGVMLRGSKDQFDLSSQNFSSGIARASGKPVRFETFYLNSVDLPWCQYYLYGTSQELGHFIESMAIDISGARFSWDAENKTIDIEGAPVIWPEVASPADLPEPAASFVTKDGVIRLPYDGRDAQAVLRAASEVTKLCQEISKRVN